MVRGEPPNDRFVNAGPIDDDTLLFGNFPSRSWIRFRVGDTDLSERWLSGRKRRFAKPLYGSNSYRGSESPLSAEVRIVADSRPTRSLPGKYFLPVIPHGRSPGLSDRDRPVASSAQGNGRAKRVVMSEFGVFGDGCASTVQRSSIGVSRASCFSVVSEVACRA